MSGMLRDAAALIEALDLASSDPAAMYDALDLCDRRMLAPVLGFLAQQICDDEALVRLLAVAPERRMPIIGTALGESLAQLDAERG